MSRTRTQSVSEPRTTTAPQAVTEIHAGADCRAETGVRTLAVAGAGTDALSPVGGERREFPWRWGRRLPVRRIVCLVPFALVVVWTFGNWSLVTSGVGRLGAADPGWLVMGGVLTGLCWVAASCVRQGTIVERLPAGRLLASQFAAGAANHLLPVGLGAHVVTLRFLRGCGVPLDRSTAALALYTLVEAVARIALLVGLVMAFPGALRLHELLPPGRVLSTAGFALGFAVVGALAVVGAVLVTVRRLRRVVAGFLRTALMDARTLHAMPARTLALWGGAFAFPLLQSGVLVCVAFALGLSLPWAYVVIAHLTARMAAGLIPAPGGIGSVEPALALSLVAAGAPLVVATATVIGFRFLTVWLPLLPGVAVLAVLVRRRIL
ncbi:YbhN family protein [Streptomyces sp. NPDC051018]|uniref:YbhN family protein n=1 Tax=Streptomyces sp. NPDC051018 TaxID=3365639 RepID=UPI00378E2A07